MTNYITSLLGIESFTIKQIIDTIIESGKFSNALTEDEIKKMLLDRRPVELLLMMKEFTAVKS
jgi:hypothetical protein